jgi:hypothetical protein
MVSEIYKAELSPEERIPVSGELKLRESICI